MFQRFKVTKLPDASGNLEVFIEKGKDIRVLKTYLTLPLYTSNVVRDVSLERLDGTVLDTEKATYRTSEAIGLVFTEEYILPAVEPILKIDTHTVIVAAAGRTITIECVYEEL